MKQFCLRIDTKTYEKIKNRSDEKALELSEYLRRLVELGLRIEEVSEKKEEKNSQKIDSFSELGSTKFLWEKELVWTLEIRFLIRFLADKLLLGKEQIDGNVINESKVRAENFVRGLLNNQPDEK